MVVKSSTPWCPHQTLIIFYNVGFGLLGEWSFTKILIATLLLYFLQIILAGGGCQSFYMAQWNVYGDN